MADLKLTKIVKAYGDVEVLHGIDLDIKRGEFVVFVGPSGCGKSTLLRTIAGLERITAGTMEIDGQVVNNIPPSERGIAMVFQTYALYPHMTVYDNMAFGMRLAKKSKEEIEERVKNAADILQLGPYLDRLPKALSGGQRQRVAIGRAICRDPKREHGKVLVVEEPKDVIALEQTGMYRGVYHVLMGRLSPLDGIGPEDLTIEGLLERVERPGANCDVAVGEVILGLNPTIEGDGTALYLAEQLHAREVRVSRLARGLPTGWNLEFANKAVLADALQGRQEMQ